MLFQSKENWYYVKIYYYRVWIISIMTNIDSKVF